MSKKVENKRLEPPGTTIKNCTFIGVQWDGQVLEAVCSVARALENLTKVFVSQGVQIGPMIEVKGE